MYDNLSKLTA